MNPVALEGRNDGSRILLRIYTSALLILIATLLSGNPPLVRAHENPELLVKPNPAPWGGEVDVQGEKFEEEEEVTLTLMGATAQVHLGVVKTDREGRFQFKGQLPHDAHPGNYQLVVRSKDAKAMATIRIVAGGEEAPLLEHTAGLGFHVSGTAPERAVIAAVVAILALGGVALIRMKPPA